MPNQLFDGKPGGFNAGYRWANEAEWLQGSEQPEAQTARENLNSWFADYPAEDAAEMKARLLKTNDATHYGAASELFVFALYRRAGFRVTVHPSVPGTERRPDFLVEDGATGYVEVLTLLDDAENETERKLLDDLRHHLDQMPAGPFLICISPNEPLKNTPPLARIRRSVEEWLGSLDPESVPRPYHPETAPSLDFVEDGFDLTFHALPGANLKDGTGVVGALMGRAQVLIGKDRLRSRLAKKSGSAYGELEEPLIIAAVSRGILVQPETFMEALYGTSAVDFLSSESGEVTTRERRKGDGFFGHGPSGPKNKRVSAVLQVRRFQSFEPERAECALLHNPFAAYPWPPGLVGIREFAVTERNARLLTMDWMG